MFGPTSVNGRLLILGFEWTPFAQAKRIQSTTVEVPLPFAPAAIVVFAEKKDPDTRNVT